MLRRRFLMHAGLTARALAASRRPNILFLSVDDLNPSLGCFGNRQVKTPNIDRLAARGFRFTAAQANFAACAPSRASLLSGWYPERTGMISFAPRPRDGRLRDAVYLPQHFRSQGYVTARLDKVFHIGSDEPSCWDITEEPIKDEQGRSLVVRTPQEIRVQQLAPRTIESGKCNRCRGEVQDYAVVDVEDRELIDGLTSRRAVELLDTFAKGSQPYFLAVGLRRPHLPIVVPQKYVDLYPPEKVELPPVPPNHDDTWVPREEQRRIIARYYAAVTYMDARVGEILAALERTGQAGNTIVVLFGDQGYAHGERDNHYGKGTLGGRSFSVPLIFAGPGVQNRGAACSRVVELLDIYPTLVDLCGLPMPGSRLQGRSLRPLIRNPKTAWEERAVSAWGTVDNQRPGLSVRTARYRYSEKPDRTPLEMFDYAKDPHEWHNVVADPAYAPVRGTLRAILDQDRT